MPDLTSHTDPVSFANNVTSLIRHNLCDDIAIAKWSVNKNYVSYQRDHSHTLSLYFSGGENSFREDQRGNYGRAGVLCLMPQGHRSKWHINDKINFAHLYFSDAAFKEFASLNFDVDNRLVDLQDLTYGTDAMLKNQVQHYFRICNQADKHAGIRGEETLYLIFAHLLDNYCSAHLRQRYVKGGLSQRHMKIVKEAVSASIAAKVRISDLADLVGLSPYHFCRTFKVTFGLSPANYITLARIQKVKQLLATDTPLASVGMATGFCQQSHMSNTFKKATGHTPSEYRKILMEV